MPDLIAWMPGLLVVLGAVFGFSMDRLIRLRRPDGDSGDYWSRIVEWCLYSLATLMLLSWLSKSLGGWPGLYLDQTANARPIHYWLVLIAPFVLWVVALPAGLFVNPAQCMSARWIAGGVGFDNTRRWLLWQALLLAVILAYGAGGLGGGEHAYPAAVWSSLAVTTLSLAGVAFSSGRSSMIEIAVLADKVEAANQLKPWPELMNAAGFRVHTLADWPATEASTRVFSDRTAQDLQTRLEIMGAEGVVPEMVEAIAALMRREPRGNDGHGAVRVVFAPDDCGQTEAIALIASLLNRQSQSICVVITPSGAHDLAEDLRNWTPEAGRRLVALGYGELPVDAAVWTVDAEILSDHLLPKLKDSPRYFARISLVVWWRLHDYSGVMAANLWAITRRFHRLLRIYGREDLRTLAFLRTGADTAQASDFVRRLLPHANLNNSISHVTPRRSLPVSLHVLQVQDIHNAPRQYLLLRAAAASVAGQWPTAVAPPDFISASEVSQFRGQSAQAGTLGDRLRPGPSKAGPDYLAWIPPTCWLCRTT